MITRLMHHRWLRWRDWWVVMSRNESQASLKHVLMNHMPTYANVSLLSKECSVGYFKNNGIFIDASQCKSDGLAVFGRTVYPPCFLIQHRPQIMWGVRSVAFSGIRESMVVGPNACLSSTWWISKWIKNTKSVKIVWWCEE